MTSIIIGGYYAILLKGSKVPAWWRVTGIGYEENENGGIELCLFLHANGHLMSRSFVCSPDIEKIKEIPQDLIHTLENDPGAAIEFSKDGSVILSEHGIFDCTEGEKK